MSMLDKPLYRRGFLMSLAGGAGVCSLLAAVDKTVKGARFGSPSSMRTESRRESRKWTKS
jgi:hypothetical protein